MKQWETINKLASEFKDWDDFKNSDFFYKITTWNPETNGNRYLKMLLYNLGKNLTEREFNLLDKIKNRNIGNPDSVIIQNREIDFDYLHSVYELSTIDYNLFKPEFRSVIEIGAGYGRTCHSLLSFFENINNYTIVDLDTMLEYSKKYLESVLDKSMYKKINFVSVNDFGKLNENFDLAIQIDGFNEMSKDDVYNYLDYINNNCNYFYVKNPVGKYFDKSLDKHCLGEEMVQNALNAGVLKDMIDANNDLDIKEKSRIFNKTYKPSDDWNMIYSSWAKPTPYMWETIYRRKS